LIHKIFKIHFILLVLVSCKHQETPISRDTNEPLIVYNLDTYFKIQEKYQNQKIKIIDTQCINQRKRAKSDIEKEKLIYFHSKTSYEWKEMAELLTTYNIIFQDYWHYCFAPPTGFEHDCYEKEMWAAIDTKYGNTLIDSLWNIAERNFVLKYPDSLYIKGGMDIRKKYLVK